MLDTDDITSHYQKLLTDGIYHKLNLRWCQKLHNLSSIPVYKPSSSPIQFGSIIDAVLKHGKWQNAFSWNITKYILYSHMQKTDKYAIKLTHV